MTIQTCTLESTTMPDEPLTREQLEARITKLRSERARWKNISFDLTDRIAALTADRDAALARAEAAERERIDLKKAYLTRDPFHDLCPDHRDKFRGKPCLACQVEAADRERDALRELLRYVFYRRNPGGNKVSDEMMMDEPHKAQECFDALRAGKEPK